MLTHVEYIKTVETMKKINIKGEANNRGGEIRSKQYFLQERAEKDRKGHERVKRGHKWVESQEREGKRRNIIIAGKSRKGLKRSGKSRKG